MDQPPQQTPQPPTPEASAYDDARRARETTEGKCLTGLVDFSRERRTA